MPTNLIHLASSRKIANLVAKFVPPRRFQQKGHATLAGLAVLSAYHVHNFLEDKPFDNKHSQRLINDARVHKPITTVRVKYPISADTFMKLSRRPVHTPVTALGMTAKFLDDLKFATTCRVAVAGSPAFENSPARQKVSARILSFLPQSLALRR